MVRIVYEKRENKIIMVTKHKNKEISYFSIKNGFKHI